LGHIAAGNHNKRVVKKKDLPPREKKIPRGCKRYRNYFRGKRKERSKRPREKEARDQEYGARKEGVTKKSEML